MTASQRVVWRLLALSIASAVAVVVLANVAGSGLLARLLVYAFVAGLASSGLATALAFHASAPRRLRRIGTAIFGTYVFTAAAIVAWVLVERPAFG